MVTESAGWWLEEQLGLYAWQVDEEVGAVQVGRQVVEEVGSVQVGCGSVYQEGAQREWEDWRRVEEPDPFAASTPQAEVELVDT